MEPVARTLGMSVREVSAAALHMATAEMATLVHELTIERGHDPRTFPLIAFGGAGPLFLSPLLEELELERGIVPARAATLSALGAALADVVLDLVRTESDPARMVPAVRELRDRAVQQMAADGFGTPTVEAAADVRYAGQWAELEIPAGEGEEFPAVAARFEAEHQRLFGHTRPEEPVELVGVRVRAVATGPRSSGAAPPPPTPGGRRVAIYGRGEVDAVVVDEADTTLVVFPGQRLSVLDGGHMEVRR
jgi:N-methylhydantoinase A